MERGVKHRPRRRSPLPFLLLAVAVVGCAFAVAVAAVVPMEADSHGGQDQAVWPGDKAVMESKCGPATAAHAGKPGNADTYARPIHTGRSGS